VFVPNNVPWHLRSFLEFCDVQSFGVSLFTAYASQLNPGSIPSSFATYLARLSTTFEVFSFFFPLFLQSTIWPSPLPLRP